MEDEKIFKIELRIAATGTVYSAEISKDTTVKDIINALMQQENLELHLGLGWNMLYSGRVLTNETVLSNLIDENSNTTFELIAKVMAG